MSGINPLPIVGSTAASFLGNIISSAAVDVVGVFTSDLVQVFRSGRPLKAQVKETNKIMQHPVETGATITDHVITEPVQIELSLIFASENYKSAYEQVKQLSLNRTLLTVQTRATVYKNMIIAEMPHQEDAELYDALTMALKLQEVIFANTIIQGIIPRDPTNSATQNRGNVQTTPATPSQTGSVGAGIVDYVTGKFQ